MKKSVLIAILAMPLMLLAADAKTANPFQLKASTPKTVYKVGTVIPVTLNVTYPASHWVCMTSIFAYVPGLPADFVKKTGVKVNKYKGNDRRWDTVNFWSSKWLPAAQRKFKKYDLKIDTSKWIRGDYNIQLNTYLRAMDGKTKPVEKYLQTSIIFTLE